MFATASFAEVNYLFNAGLFYDKDGSEITKSLSFALVADFTGNGFAKSFELTDGDSFAVGEFINAKNEYKTFAVGALKEDPDLLWYAIAENLKIDNEKVGLEKGADFALIVYDPSNAGKLTAGDSFCIYTPSFAIEDGVEMSVALSGGDEWKVQEADQWTIALATMDFAENPLDNSYTTLSSVVLAVPEPSTYAVLFGAIALGLAVYRRRK